MGKSTGYKIENIEDIGIILNYTTYTTKARAKYTILYYTRYLFGTHCLRKEKTTKIRSYLSFVNTP